MSFNLSRYYISNLAFFTTLLYYYTSILYINLCYFKFIFIGGRNIEVKVKKYMFINIKRFYKRFILYHLQNLKSCV